MEVGQRAIFKCLDSRFLSLDSFMGVACGRALRSCTGLSHRAGIRYR